MANPPSPTGRLLDDDMPPPHGISGGPRPRPKVVPQAAPQRVEPPRLAAPKVAAPVVPPLQPAQRACYEALGLALQEGHVFAAVTGPEGSGKTTVLEAVLADRHDRALRCIRISDADKVPARLAAQIEQVAYAEASKPENLERHVVLAIDDAHTASHDLLRCLARLASMREPGRRVPQILLVGRPELWARLATEEYAPLARRVAIRAVLPKLQDEQDPWASLEQEVSQTMSQLRADSEMLPAVAADAKLRPLFDRTPNDTLPAAIDEAGLPFDPETIAPPTDFALFPDPPPRAAPAPSSSSRRRLALPLGCLLVAIAAFTFVLSYFDWPGVFDDMPWSEGKPPASFAFAPQANPPVLPQTPAWAQPTQRMGQPNPARPAAAPATPSPPTLVMAPPPAPRTSLSPASVSAPPVVTQAAPRAPVTPAPSPVAAPRPAVPPPVAVAAVTPPPVVEPVPSAPKPAEPALSAAKPAEPAPSAPKPAEPAPQPAAVAPPPPPPPPPRVEPAKPAEAAAKPAEAPKPEAPKPSAESPAVVAALTAPPASAPPSRSSRGATSAVVKPAPLPPAIVGLLLRRGDEQLAIGDVSAARLLFERAAESGNAQGAFRLARTYDANFLPAADAATLANRNEARIWYGRAASLGDKEAASRLKDMNEGR